MYYIKIYFNSCKILTLNKVGNIVKIGNIVKNLGIKYNNDIRLDNDPVINAIKIHKGHASIRKIKDLSGENNIFCFDLVTFDEVCEEIDKLDTYKTSQHLDIPTKIIKQNVDIFTPYLHESFNNMLEYSSFPNEMKNADVIPIFKKGSDRQGKLQTTRHTSKLI